MKTNGSNWRNTSVELPLAPLAIYCNPDHVHFLLGLNPDISVSDNSGRIKANSSRWINSKKWFIGKFQWQTGYGAFSYSKSQVDPVTKYILNQPRHHQRTSFKIEYLSILNKQYLAYDSNYLFEWYD